MAECEYRAVPIKPGAVLQQIRRSRGIKQGVIAKATGLNPSTLSDLENDKSDPQFSTISVVAAALFLKGDGANLFDALANLLAHDPLGALDPNAPAHQTEIVDAHPARARSEEPEGPSVPTAAEEDRFRRFRTLVLHFTDAYQGAENEDELYRELRAAAEGLAQRKRESEKTRKKS